MDLHIDEAIVSDDAMQIKNIVDEVLETMDRLNNQIIPKIQSEIQTEWAKGLQSDWEQYHRNAIPDVAEQMRASAENLQSSINAWHEINHA